jgi:hypothetical protein
MTHLIVGIVLGLGEGWVLTSWYHDKQGLKIAVKRGKK